MNMFILITHAAFTKEKTDVHGPAHAVDNFLTVKKLLHVFLRHPIYGGFGSVIDENGKTEFCGGKKIALWLRPLWEVYTNLKLCEKYQAQKPIFIGVDPLNAFSGLMAKFLGWVQVVVFYTPDYTEQRFANKLFNSLYHVIDLVAARNSDQIWCVSKAIVNIRQQQKVDKEKIYYVPNTPSLRLVGKLPTNNKGNHNLVMVGNVNRTLNYSLVIESVKELQKKIPDIKLLIAGAGEYMSELKKLVKEKKLEKTIEFLGALPHDKVLKLLKKCGVGVALYSGEFGTNLFGDSMKIREYLACGLPVVTTDVTETACVVKDFQAGEVISLEKKSFLKAVETIFKSYTFYRKNALACAQKFDFDKMISMPLKKLDV